MIKPGWKREVCPQCHMPGLVWKRLHKDRAIPNSSVIAVRWTFGGMEMHSDVCDNCGVLYVYEAIESSIK